MSAAEASFYAGRTAVVTGASSGIGRALTQRLLGYGASVVATDVAEAGLESLTQESGSERLFTFVSDVSAEDSMLELKSFADHTIGSVDFLFNNAGVVYNSEPIWKAPASAVEWSFGVNVYGVLNGTRAFAPEMERRGSGHIINTASIGGFQVSARTDVWQQGLYASTKYAVVAISEALRIELEPHGVHVSIFAPSAVSTQIGESGRNRPERFGGVTAEASPSSMKAMLDSEGMSPDQAAGMLLDGVAQKKFYIFTDTNLQGRITDRHAEIEAGLRLVDSASEAQHA